MNSKADQSAPTTSASNADERDTTTPYEERYRLVYAAGGERFYPKVPSRNLTIFLDGWTTRIGVAAITGCGEGRNIPALVDKAWAVLGIDSAESALQIAKRDNASAANVTLIRADLLGEMMVPEGSVDLVVSIEFLHLLTTVVERTKFYRNVYRMLRPGGIVFFENNGRLDADETAQLAGGKIEPRTIQTESGPIQIPLMRLPTVMLNGKTLRSELEGNGFVVDSMRSDAFQHPDTLREQIITIVHKP